MPLSLAVRHRGATLPSAVDLGDIQTRCTKRYLHCQAFIAHVQILYKRVHNIKEKKKCQQIANYMQTYI